MNSQTNFHFNPLDRRFQEAPYEVYREMLSHGPLHRTRFGIWVAVGHDECSLILSDARFTRDHSTSPMRSTQDRIESAALDSTRQAMLNLDAGLHKNIRREFSYLFSARRLSKFGKYIEKLAADLCHDLIENQSTDLLSDFAIPLSLRTIKKVLGIESCNDGVILNFVKTNGIFFEPVRASPEQLKEAEKHHSKLFKFLQRELDSAAEGHPLDQLKKSIKSGKIDDSGALSNLAFVLSAGIETTVNLICEGYKHIVSGKVSLEALQADEALNELIRLAPSIHMTSRYASVDIELAGKRIAAGSFVIVVIAAGNRDPRKFEHPDQINPQSNNQTNLSFGAGPHFCLGFHLAKLEARIAWLQLTKTLGKIHETDIELKHEQRAFIRSPVSMNLLNKNF